MNKPTPPLLSGAILVLLTLNLLVILGSSARAQSGRVKWEYAIFAGHTTTELNNAGNQGWEVVQLMADKTFLFKRPK